MTGHNPAFISGFDPSLNGSRCVCVYFNFFFRGHKRSLRESAMFISYRLGSLRATNNADGLDLYCAHGSGRRDMHLDSGRNDLYPARTEPNRDLIWYVDVGIDPDAQGSFPSRRSFWRSGDSDASARNFSYSCNWSAI